MSKNRNKPVQVFTSFDELENWKRSEEQKRRAKQPLKLSATHVKTPNPTGKKKQ